MASSPDLTTAQRRRLRELCGAAYEKDLSAELALLEAAFQRWRAGDVDAFELSDLIHKFHEGPSRELFVKYDQADVVWPVASAIQRGLLTEQEVGTDVLNLLRSQLEFLRGLDKE